jgi:hypothetical protein
LYVPAPCANVTRSARCTAVTWPNIESPIAEDSDRPRSTQRANVAITFALDDIGSPSKLLVTSLRSLRLSRRTSRLNRIRNDDHRPHYRPLRAKLDKSNEKCRVGALRNALPPFSRGVEESIATAPPGNSPQSTASSERLWEMPDRNARGALASCNRCRLSTSFVLVSN